MLFSLLISPLATAGLTDHDEFKNNVDVLKVRILGMWTGDDYTVTNILNNWIYTIMVEEDVDFFDPDQLFVNVMPAQHIIGPHNEDQLAVPVMLFEDILSDSPVNWPPGGGANRIRREDTKLVAHFTSVGNPNHRDAYTLEVIATPVGGGGSFGAYEIWLFGEHQGLVVPGPATLAMLGLGLVGLGATRRRRTA